MITEPNNMCKKIWMNCKYDTASEPYSATWTPTKSYKYITYVTKIASSNLFFILAWTRSDFMVKTGAKYYNEVEKNLKWFWKWNKADKPIKEIFIKRIFIN